MSSLVETEEDPSNRISSYYNGRSILITGGTGFLGKVLVEKLLRLCQGINKIYLLIRPKNNKTISERMEEYLQDPVFSKIREKTSKITAVSSSLASVNLGLAESWLQTITKEVSVVFHVAATVRFDEPLSTAIATNVIGTMRVVDLCKQLNEPILVYVSTAYCNCDLPWIDEVFYEQQLNPERVIQALKAMNEELITKLTPRLLGKLPNTYTYTKKMSETIIMKSRVCRTAVIRPTIVLGAWQEPEPGWVDNWNGPIGVVAACYTGLYQTVLCKEEVIADIIPVDIVGNLLIASAWKTSQSKQNEITFYNCGTGVQNPVTWGQFTHTCIDNIHDFPLDNAMGYPKATCYVLNVTNTLSSFVTEKIPAGIYDIVLRLLGKKGNVLAKINRMYNSMKTYRYFTVNEWVFSNNNVRLLSEELTCTEAAMFSCDVRQIDWKIYLKNLVLGIRRHLFKQPDVTVPTARRRQMLLRGYYHILRMFFLIVLFLKVPVLKKVLVIMIGTLQSVLRMIPYL